MPETPDTLPLRAAIRTLAQPPRPAPPPAGRNAPLRRMHFNEGWWPPSPKATEALTAAISGGGLNRYHDSYWSRLAAAIARQTGVAEDRIVAGNGSAELIALASQAFLEPGKRAIVSWPTFPRLRSNAVIVGGAAKSVPVRADGGNDIDGLLAAVDETTPLLWLTTPNNPTGAAATAGEIERLARALPAHCVLGVDEAYGEFARAEGGADALAVLGGLDRPWFVLRTFSKAYGLAGMRVGYGLMSNAALADAFHKLRQTFNLNMTAQIAAAAAMDDPDYMWARVTACIAERNRLRDTLAARGLRYLPSQANFLAVDAGRPGLEVVAALRAQHGILVSAIGNAPGFENFIRVTVGAAEDNDFFADALLRVLAQR